MIAKLFHNRKTLLINFGRVTVKVEGVTRETVRADLDMTGFVPFGDWKHGRAIDETKVRRKEHRFDIERHRPGQVPRVA